MDRTLFHLHPSKPDLQPEIPAEVVLAALEMAHKLADPLSPVGMRRILQAAENAANRASVEE